MNSVDWLNISLPVDLIGRYINWNISYYSFVINNSISNDLFSVNRSFNFLLSDNRCLNNLLFDDWLRNDFSLNNRLWNDFLFNLLSCLNFLSLLNLRFRVINLTAVNFIDGTCIINPLLSISIKRSQIMSLSIGIRIHRS